MSGRSEDTVSERIGRVRVLLSAAARLANPADPLGDEARRLLPAATGLSPAGVELGLTRHLETDASEDDLARLVERAGTAARVHVVLSANVFVGAVRAVALALAASRSVWVRPSSREAVMVPLLARALRDSGAASFETCDALAAKAGDRVDVYGRRETIATIERACPPGVSIVGHGPGFGVALVEPSSMPLEVAAERLSWDIITFDQRGCLSPRIAFVRGTGEDAEALAKTLADALERREKEVPRGALTEHERRDLALYRHTVSAVGSYRAGSANAVGVDASPRALLLPPSGRHIHVVRVTDAAELGPLLAPFAGAITCVGHPPETPFVDAVLALARGARSLRLGAMQSPPLDGPVDLRGML